MAKKRDLDCGKFGNKTTLTRFLDRINRELTTMDEKLQKHLAHPKIVGTCYQGTMLDVRDCMLAARCNLENAIDGLK